MSGIKQIPFYGIDRQYTNIREEILSVTDLIYKSGKVLDGQYTRMFENALKQRFNRKYAITVNSGTQALIFALRAIDRSPHSPNKIIIPAQSFIATLNSVLEAGYDPVFCDVNPVTGLIDIGAIPCEISEIAAVMYVNLFGNIVDQTVLTSFKTIWGGHNIPIIEDAAQSFGAMYNNIPSGKLGDISVFSFDPTKNLNNYGSGGMVLTDDPELFELINDFKDNGKGNDHIATGTNSKMSEADCAQMLIKLAHFDTWQRRRRTIAEYYTSELDGIVEIPQVDANVVHAYSKFVVHSPSRGRILDGIREDGVEARVQYKIPLHLHPIAYGRATMSYDPGILSGAEEFSRTAFSLPIYPELDDSEVEYIVDAVKRNIY